MADILLVDDDATVAFPLQELLQLEGHAVRFAENGKIGLEEVSSRMPDILLLDVEMPIMDGPDMAIQLLVRDAGAELIPVILLSGSEKLIEVAKELGTPYYLEKPYRFEDLLTILSKALREKSPPRYESIGKEKNAA